MPTTCTTPTQPVSCVSPLPDFDFNLCAPEIHVGEIKQILITNIGNPLTDENDPAEWATRRALLTTNPAKIIALSCVAEKPAASSSEIVISDNRTVTLFKEHVINGEIHETGIKNYDAMRTLEFARKLAFWYVTADGQLYGGPSGIEASITMNEVIPKSRKEAILFSFTIKWEAKLHPCRTTAPF
jgi:hypothetical protein